MSTEIKSLTEPRFSVEIDTHETDRNEEDRHCVYDDDFGYDALIRVTGDFGTAERQKEYVQAVCDALNAAQIPTDKTTELPE